MTYLFSENRELKNIQDGDVVVWDCENKGRFRFKMFEYAIFNNLALHFKWVDPICMPKFYTAHFTRINTEPQPAPNTPAPMGSN